MGPSRRHGVIFGAVLMLALPFSGSLATPQNAQLDERLTNIELCNGSDRKSPESQISGCTALIKGSYETAQILATAHNNRGNAYSRKGDFDRAIEDYGLAIQFNPNYDKAFNNRGVAFQKKGELDRAIKDFNEAIQLNPNYGNAFANRAETYQKKFDFAHAALDYDDAIRLEPNLEVIWNGRCWTRAILGQLQTALADCNKALLLQPDDPAAYDFAGIDLSQDGSIRFSDPRL